MRKAAAQIFYRIKKTPLYRLLVGGEDDVKQQ